MPDFKNMTTERLSAWYVENVGYDLAQDDPSMTLEEFRERCAEMHRLHTEGDELLIEHACEPLNDTDRLNWVLLRSPEFDEGKMRFWVGPHEDAELERNGSGAYYITTGATARECIDNALNGRGLTRLT